MQINLFLTVLDPRMSKRRSIRLFPINVTISINVTIQISKDFSDDTLGANWQLTVNLFHWTCLFCWVVTLLSDSVWLWSYSANHVLWSSSARPKAVCLESSSYCYHKHHDINYCLQVFSVHKFLSRFQGHFQTKPFTPFRGSFRRSSSDVLK